MTFTRSAKAAALFARLHPPGSEEEAIVLATAKGQSAHSVAPELRTVAALYVLPNGPYVGLPGVDPWPESRDARLYAGPHPVVAHPPCERWGRYWSGGPSNHGTRQLGADAGCFAAALASVRRWGGVIEHPEASHAWRAHGLAAPPRDGGWVNADFVGGWTCCVEQGHFGHPARKATWLYAVGCELPVLPWGTCGTRGRLGAGYHSAEERRRAVRRGVVECVPKSQRSVTPDAFRDLLLAMARSAVPVGADTTPRLGGVR